MKIKNAGIGPRFLRNASLLPSMVFLTEFMSKHGLSTGDHIRVEWKGMTVEGTILPIPHAEKSPYVNIKMSSGYNTGLAIENITSVSKTAIVASGKKENQTQVVQVHVDSEKKPGLSLITTGGTIGSKIDYKTAGVNALMKPDELLTLVPQIGEFAHFHTVTSPFAKLSENMGAADWIQIATICFEELKKEEVKGVLITHGTDMLHYTAAALSFMLRNLNKPVVLVGSQRSSDRGSSDAPFNLTCASRIAISDMAEVGICMHGTTSDDYCLFTRGTNVRKMHASRRDAFRPMNDKPICTVTPDGKMDYLNTYTPRDDSRKLELDAIFEKVALVKTYPDMPASILDYHADNGAKGIVIEAAGIGGVHSDWAPTIRKLVNRGIPVFVTVQVLYGRVNLNVYSNGRLLQQAGAVGLEDMLPEVAYVKLGWVLAHTKDPVKVKEMMFTNYAREMSPFSRTDTFLQ